MYKNIIILTYQFGLIPKTYNSILKIKKVIIMITPH